MAQFCGQCGGQALAGANFCGFCGAILPLPPSQTPAGQRIPQQYASVESAPSPCVPLLKTGSWLVGETRVLFQDNVTAEYRVGGGQKQRVLFLSHLGNFLINKAGSDETRASCSEHLANLREVTREDRAIKLSFSSRVWRITCSAAEQSAQLLKAIVTLGMILHQGPPAFPVFDQNQGDKLDLSAYHLFVDPTDEYIISKNLPFGWELSYVAAAPGTPPTPYYVNHRTQQSHWTLPPDVVEVIPIAKIRKYPRYLADCGLYMSTRMWCAHLHWTWDQACPSQSVAHAGGGEGGRTVEVQRLVEAMVRGSCSGLDVNGMLERAFVPALCRALALNPLFSGIRFDARTGPAALSSPALQVPPSAMQWHRRGQRDLLLLLRGIVPRLTTLSLRSRLDATPLPAVVPGVVRVQVHAMRHLPKIYTFGSCDGYVSVVVRANGMPMGLAPDVYGGDNVSTSGCFKVRVAPLEAQNSDVIKGQYDPDMHSKRFGGHVRSLFFTLPAGVEPRCDLQVQAKAMGVKSMGKDAVIGDVKFAEMKVAEMDKEGWFEVADPRTGAAVLGKDGQPCQVYMRVTRLDSLNALATLALAPGAMVQGALVRLDLTCQQLPAAALDFFLSHAGSLRELRLGGCCHGDAAQQQAAGAVVLRHLLESLRVPGAPVPSGWQAGRHYVCNCAKALAPGRMVVLHSAASAALPWGWEQLADPQGKAYYQNNQDQSTHWLPPPGDGRVLAVVKNVQADGSCVVELGGGRSEDSTAASVGLLSPHLRGWGGGLRVLDVTLLPSSLSWALAAAVVAMPSLQELHMAMVSPVRVIAALADAPSKGRTLPPLRVLDMSQLLPPDHPAAAANAVAPRTAIDLARFPAALQALEGSLRDVRMKGLLPLASDAAGVIGQLLECCSVSLGESTLELGAMSEPSQLTAMVARTAFSGTLSLDGASPATAHAVLVGLAENGSVRGLTLHGAWQGRHLVWEASVQSALTQLLQRNATLQTIRLSGPPGFFSQRVPGAQPPPHVLHPPAGVPWIELGLAENKGVLLLDAEDCWLGDRGGTALGAALRRNRTLQSLRLDRNHMALDGWKAWRGCLYGNRKLTHCPLPRQDLASLVGGLDSAVQDSERTVMQAKANIKIACRGGHVKPWLGNPALKQSSLEQLRAAKRQQGANLRYKAKVEREVPLIWMEIDKNAALFAQKTAEKRARQEARRAEAQRRQMAREYAAMEKQRLQVRRWQQRHGHRRPYGGGGGGHNHHDHHHGGLFGGGFGGGGFGMPGHGMHGMHNPHYDYYDEHDNWNQEEELVDAEVGVDALQEQAAFEEAEGAAGEEAAAAAAEAEGEAQPAEGTEGDAADDLLADVEAYAAAGPRDLPGGGRGGRRTAVRADKVRAGEDERERCADRARALLEEWRAKHTQEMEALRGGAVLHYRTMPDVVAPQSGRGCEGVTLVTQASVDRLPRLEGQASAWRGPVSAAVFVGAEEEVGEALDQLAAMAARLRAEGQEELRVSVLLGRRGPEIEYDNQYPINALRNLALRAARSPLVLLIDVDFVPSCSLAALCSPTHPSFRDMERMACDDGEVLVVPAFEVRGEEEDASELPRGTRELRELWDAGEAEGFHVSSFPRGHSPTNFGKWWSSSQPYSVEYEMYFEPYVIMDRATVPSYDERFRGYGMNKISHLMEVAASGRRFTVLPSVFVAAAAHRRSAAWHHAFGLHRDPAHAIRVAYILSSFKQRLMERYGLDCLPEGGESKRASQELSSRSVAHHSSTRAEPLQVLEEDRAADADAAEAESTTETAGSAARGNEAVATPLRLTSGAAHRRRRIRSRLLTPSASGGPVTLELHSVSPRLLFSGVGVAPSAQANSSRPHAASAPTRGGRLRQCGSPSHRRWPQQPFDDTGGSKSTA